MLILAFSVSHAVRFSPAPPASHRTRGAALTPEARHSQRHQPKRQIRMPLMLRVQPVLHLAVGAQKIFLTLPEMP